MKIMLAKKLSTLILKEYRKNDQKDETIIIKNAFDIFNLHWTKLIADEKIGKILFFSFFDIL